MAGDWLEGCFFNLLVDYWSFILCRPYGSGCTRENYLPVLRRLKPGFLVVYAKGESGHSSFPSALKSEHPKLAQNLPRFFRKLTREMGTKLFLYYSGLEDGVAAAAHPDWRLRDKNGKPVKFFSEFIPDDVACSAMCPQSRYLDDWVAMHLREMMKFGDPDGIWVDGTWVGPCYCRRCVGRYRRETGFRGKLPEGIEWTRYWAKVQFEFRSRFLERVRSLKPSCRCSFGNITVRQEFREDRDWCSGDWYSPNNHRIAQSIVMRRYTTTGLLYDAKTCDTQMVHALHHLRARTKSVARMLQEGAGLIANGGLWTYWTFPRGDGALVPSRMRRAAIAARFARQRKNICQRTESVRWTAILDLDPNARLWGDGVWGAAKALIHLHRSPDLMDETGLADDMPYDLIVLAEPDQVSTEVMAGLERFVRRGGKLLNVGTNRVPPELQKLLGIEVVRRGAAKDCHVFLQNADPCGVGAAWDKVALAGARVLYPLYFSWDSRNPKAKKILPHIAITNQVDEDNPEPAGFPAATLRKLGKGLAVHIPANAFSVYWRDGFLDIKAWLGEILEFLQPRPLFRTDAPSWVEVALRQRDDTLFVHFINGNPGRDLSHVGTSDLWVDEIPVVGPYRFWIRSARKPGRATWEPGAKPARTRWKHGVLEVVLPRLEIHTCLKLPGWQRC